MNLAAQISLLLAPGAILLIGWLVRMTVWDRIKALEGKVEVSASNQGKRIGDLESWQYAVERENKAVRRVKRELLAEESRGIPLALNDDDSSK